MPEKRVAAPNQSFVGKIPLADWANLHSRLVWVYDGAVESRWRNGVMASVPLSAWLLRKGEVTVRSGKCSRQVKSGQWIFLPSGDLWRKFSDDARILSVRFSAKWPTGEELFQEGLSVVIGSGEFPELERTAGALAQFAAHTFPEARSFLKQEMATLSEHLRLQALFSSWLDVAVSALIKHGLVPSRMGRIDPRLLAAVRLVEQRSFSTPLTEREIAREIGVSVTHLSRLFVSQFGVPPHRYFDRRRHEHALAALQSSSKAIKEIAFELGFSTLPHFSAWFRRYHGMSPREFRRGGEGTTKAV